MKERKKSAHTHTHKSEVDIENRETKLDSS